MDDRIDAAAKLDFPATTRNREPIAAVLEQVLPRAGVVLEIASGSGQHCAWFAARMPDLTWQPSDMEAAHRASITAWMDDRANVRPPLTIDVLASNWADGLAADAIVCSNMIHIAPWDACLGLFAGAAQVLDQAGQAGRLVLYGPFRVDGAHTAPSNEAFDRSLQVRDPSWGVRDREAVAAVAASHGFVLRETIAMPANNLVLVFQAANR